MSELEHYGNEIYAIEERIARLAIVCGLDLENNIHVSAVKKGNFVFCVNGDKASHQLFHEMLLLRDYVKSHCASERGSDRCRDIIDDVEERLRQHGFRD
jgi:ribosomal protein S3AE